MDWTSYMCRARGVRFERNIFNLLINREESFFPRRATGFRTVVSRVALRGVAVGLGVFLVLARKLGCEGISLGRSYSA